MSLLLGILASKGLSNILYMTNEDWILGFSYTEDWFKIMIDICVFCVQNETEAMEWMRSPRESVGKAKID